MNVKYTRTIALVVALLTLVAWQGLAQKKQTPSKKSAPGQARSTAGTLRQAPSKPLPPTQDAQLRRYLELLQSGDTVAAARIAPVPGRSEDQRARFARLFLFAREDRDSIVLRWGPSTAGGWAVANGIGYRLERITLHADGKPDTASRRMLTPPALKPWTLDEWNRRAPKRQGLTAIAAEALHGKTFSPKLKKPTEQATMAASIDELTSRFGYSLFAADMDPMAADGLALRFVDRTIRPGERYVYRVFVAARDTSYGFDTAYVRAETRPFTQPPPPPGLTSEEDDGLIILHWAELPPGSRYTAYTISRADADGQFRKLNAIPMVHVIPPGADPKLAPSYPDTGIVNYRKYRYRVQGITMFGDAGAPAEIAAMGRDKTPPPAAETRKPVQVGRSATKITWKMPFTSPDLAGFTVMRSPLSLTGYQPVAVRHAGRSVADQPEELLREIRRNMLPRSATSFVDTAATPFEPYYVVASVDTAGNYIQSLPVYSELIDTVPPAMPVGLTGAIDSNGVVRLRWKKGKEPNLLGYRIYWANDPAHEFTVRNPEPLHDTTFVDTVTVQTLTRRVYFRVAAVNDRYNYSALTPMLGLLRPDRIPPSAPVFRSVTVSDSSVTLSWAGSASKDVMRQILSRRTAGQAQWTELASLDPGKESYVDRAVSKRTTYEYQLVAIDSAGLSSESSASVSGRPYDTGVRPGVTDLKATHDPKSGTVRLQWTYQPLQGESFWFVIYRGYNGATPGQLHSVEGTARAFDDRDLPGKGQLVYAIKVLTATGGASRLSATVPVVIP